MLHFFILLTHYKSSHGSEKSFTVTCNVNGCQKQYNNIQSFVRHATERHAAFLNCGGPSETGGEPAFIAIECHPGFVFVMLFNEWLKFLEFTDSYRLIKFSY